MTSSTSLFGFAYEQHEASARHYHHHQDSEHTGQTNRQPFVLHTSDSIVGKWAVRYGRVLSVVQETNFLGSLLQTVRVR